MADPAAPLPTPLAFVALSTSAIAALAADGAPLFVRDCPDDIDELERLLDDRAPGFALAVVDDGWLKRAGYAARDAALAAARERWPALRITKRAHAEALLRAAALRGQDATT